VLSKAVGAAYQRSCQLGDATVQGQWTWVDLYRGSHRGQVISVGPKLRQVAWTNSV